VDKKALFSLLFGETFFEEGDERYLFEEREQRLVAIESHIEERNMDEKKGMIEYALGCVDEILVQGEDQAPVCTNMIFVVCVLQSGDQREINIGQLRSARENYKNYRSHYDTRVAKWSPEIVGIGNILLTGDVHCVTVSRETERDPINFDVSWKKMLAVNNIDDNWGKGSHCISRQDLNKCRLLYERLKHILTNKHVTMRSQQNKTTKSGIIASIHKDPKESDDMIMVKFVNGDTASASPEEFTSTSQTSTDQDEKLQKFDSPSVSSTSISDDTIFEQTPHSSTKGKRRRETQAEKNDRQKNFLFHNIINPPPQKNMVRKRKSRQQKTLSGRQKKTPS